jgi:hypothetical protein
MNPTPKEISIQQKLMRVIMLVSGTVLLVACAAYFAYEYFTFKQSSIEQLSTLGRIISTNSTAALAFDDANEASDILGSLRAEPNIIGACLYDADGNIFARYPDSLPDNMFPQSPFQLGYVFSAYHFEGFEPVVQHNNRLGNIISPVRYERYL